MARPVSHKDIAKLVNVTQSTVSRALNPEKRDLIAPATREKIERAAEELGFQVNIFARRMRKRRWDTVTLVIDSQMMYPEIFRDFNAHQTGITWDLILGATGWYAERDFDVKLLPVCHRSEEQTAEVAKYLLRPYSDGALFLGKAFLNSAIEQFIHRGIPCVTMGMWQEPGGTSPGVVADPAVGIAQAVRHLAAAGHREIAYCQMRGMDTAAFSRSRREPFLTEIRRLGLEGGTRIIDAADEMDIRRMAACRETTDGFSAILCASDTIADRWCRELRLNGFAVPRDKAVIGYDGNPSYPELSSIHVPRREIGSRAAELLHRIIERKEDAPLQSTVLDTRFVPGATG